MSSLNPACRLAAPASELSSGWQWTDQRALPVGPASVCLGAEAAGSSNTRQRAARERPHRWVRNHPDVWSYWRFGIFFIFGIWSHSLCVSILFLAALDKSFYYMIWSLCVFSTQGDHTVYGHRGCWTSVWNLWSKRSKVELLLILRRRGQIPLGKVSFHSYTALSFLHSLVYTTFWMAQKHSQNMNQVDSKRSAGHFNKHIISSKIVGAKTLSSKTGESRRESLYSGSSHCTCTLKGELSAFSRSAKLIVNISNFFHTEVTWIWAFSHLKVRTTIWTKVHFFVTLFNLIQLVLVSLFNLEEWTKDFCMKYVCRVIFTHLSCVYLYLKLICL